MVQSRSGYHHHIAFWSVWKRCFSPVVLKVFSQNTCSDQLYVNFNFVFDKTAVLFLFFVVFFLFVLIFFEDIISKVVAARQMYTTIEGIKPSSGSVLIFFKWAAFGYINNEPIIFICSYIWKVSLVIFNTLSWKSINDIFYSTFVWFSMLSLISGYSKAGLSLDYQKRRWDCWYYIAMKCL